MPAERVKHEKLFTLEEIEQLRAWARSALREKDHTVNKRGGALVIALIGTAGRRAEVARLRCGDVRQGPDGPEVYFPKTKGGKPATVPISKDTFALLSEWIHGKPPSSPLIPTGAGKHMHVATLWRTFRQAVADAGIKRKVGVHATRHAAGFLLLRATKDLTKVQVFLRHTNLATTSGWYQHVHMPDLRVGLDDAGV